MGKIIFFNGRECPHCHVMMPIVDRLIKEGVEFEKLEVWHDEKNADYMRSFRKTAEETCGGFSGVPLFIDLKGKRAMCGEHSYEELKKWASKK